MNPELQKTILDMLNGTKDFVITQAPEVIQQVLASAYFESCLGIAAGCVLFIIFVASIIMARVSYGEDCFFASLATIVSGVLCGVVLFISIVNIYEISYFPKAYLLNHFSNGSCR